MKLEYKLFGKIATLIRYRRLKVEGELVGLRCMGAVKCRLYSEEEKKGYSFPLADGECELPIKLIEGGVSVSFEDGSGATVSAMPLSLQRVGESVYVVGGAFSQREEIERLQDALIHAVSVAEAAQEKAARVDELEKRLERLEKRAFSGDIINF